MGFYEVIVQNIGKVYEGSNAFQANVAYNRYVGFSKRGVGRAADEGVTLFRNGEVVKEHIGKVDNEI